MILDADRDEELLYMARDQYQYSDDKVLTVVGRDASIQVLGENRSSDRVSPGYKQVHGPILVQCFKVLSIPARSVSATESCPHGKMITGGKSKDPTCTAKQA